MTEPEDQGGVQRPSIDVLMEQLGVKPILEALGVDENTLGRLQAGVESETPAIREGMKRLETMMGDAVGWWKDESPVSDVVGVDLESVGMLADEAIPPATSAKRVWNWEENQENRRWSLRAMLDLAMSSTAHLGVTYQGQVAMLGLVAEIEYSLIVSGDTLPDAGQDWDGDRRMREMNRRIGRMIWVSREQERAYGGIRGVYNWLMGRKKMRPKELVQRMLREADSVMRVLPEVGEGMELRSGDDWHREEEMHYLSAADIIEGESRPLPPDRSSRDRPGEPPRPF